MALSILYVANALKLCLTTLPPNTSFESIHSLAKRSTPVQMSMYKHALQLYKLFNSNNMSEDWISLNIQQNFNRRNNTIQLINASNYKVGRNLLVNRFLNLNNKINFTWFNDSFNTFKVKCKQLLLWNNFVTVIWHTSSSNYTNDSVTNLYFLNVN